MPLRPSAKKSWTAQLCMNRATLSIKPEFLFILAVLLLLLPLQWVVAWFIAVFFHEACHYWALRLCRSPVYRVKLTIFGAYMETEALTGAKGCICALAGPLGGLLLLLVARWFPRLALCGLFQSAYNLLPIFPLDGGRALRCALGSTAAGARACRVLEWTVLLLILIFGFYGCFFLNFFNIFRL